MEKVSNRYFWDKLGEIFKTLQSILFPQLPPKNTQLDCQALKYISIDHK